MGKKSMSHFEILLDYLNEYKAHCKDGNERHVVIADAKEGHCLLVRIGWDYPHNLYAVLFHFEVKNEKVWVHRNNTEELIGEELTSRGIPAGEIILGFQPEHRRPYTGFAVA